jgi:predicted transcriptional regulator
VASRAPGRIALLSIHPRHAEAILSGHKRVELRRTPLSADVTHVALYATAPVAAIVGWFEIQGIDEASATKIWNLHGPVSGITRSEHRSYFAGATKAYAIKVAKAHRITPHMPLQSLSGVARPPQSFQYLEPAGLPWAL